MELTTDFTGVCPNPRSVGILKDDAGIDTAQDHIKQMEDVKTKQDLLIDSMNEDIKRLTDKKAGHPIGSGSDWEVLLLVWLAWTINQHKPELTMIA